jgi:hypothetical protein
MALTKKSLELPLIGGLDTKTDSKQIKLGKLLSAQNVTFHKPGKIMKREGFQSVGQTIADTGALLEDGQAVMNYNQELLAFDKTNIYSYVSSTDNWKDKGNFQSIYLTSEPVTNGVARDFMCDSAYYNGIEMYVFMRSAGGVKTLFYQAVDNATKQIIVGPVAISTTATSPRVVVFDDQFVICYYDIASNEIKRGVISSLNVLATITFQGITDPVSGVMALNPLFPCYDIMAYRTQDTPQTLFYIAFYTITNELTTAYFSDLISTTPTLSVQLAATALQQIKLQNNTNLFDLTGADSILVAYTYAGGSNLFTTAYYSYDLLTFYGTYDFDTDPDANGYVCGHITAVSYPNPTIGLELYFIAVDYSDPSVTPGQEYSVAYLIDPITGTIYEEKFRRAQISISGEAFIYASAAYLPVAGGTKLLNPTYLSSYLLFRENGEAIARYNRDTGTANYYEFYAPNPIFELSWTPHTPQLSDTEYLLSYTELIADSKVSGVSQRGVRVASFDFYEPEKSYTRAEIGGSLYIGGGMLFQYDGQNLVEDAYNWDPSLLGFTAITGSGATFSYSYVACWEWVDNTGKTHRSAPSEPIVVTTSAKIGVASTTIGNMRSYNLAVTYKSPDNNRTNINCVLYRTKANETLYYKVPVTTANINDVDIPYITFDNDTTQDDDLGIELYTDGELPNDAPPPIGALTLYKNRLWALDSTNKSVIYYSKVVDNDKPVEWSDAQVINVDPTGGPCTALAAMDDKLLIFKETSIRYISGDGPDANGANNDIRNTIFITSDAGCINTRSIVNTPEGVIFKSAKGVYFINRGLQVSYIGAPVEKWNEYFVSSAVLMSKNNQVRISLDNSSFLVYDYYVQNWATYTGVNAVDSIIWNNEHAFIGTEGKVFVETPGTYQDDGASYSMEIETGWFEFGGVQGFQRLWDMTMLGEFKTPHNLQCDLYYDFNNSPYQTIIVEPINPSFYGGGSPYGYDDPYGGLFAPYQYAILPKRQKCDSIRVRIKDIASSGSLEEGYELSNIRLSYGVIGGTNRMKATQTFG